MAYVTLTGKVARIFFDGKGADILESFEVKGKPLEKRWTAWFDQPHGLTEGAVVEVSGLHSDELNSWEKNGQTKHSVKRSLNKAKVKTAGTEIGNTNEPWVAPDTEVPF